MSVNTKTVQGRRELNFGSLDEVFADAEKLVASSNTKVLGNWPLSRLLTHLTRGINASMGGSSAKASWFLRLVVPQITIVRPPRPDYLQIVHSLPIFHSKSPGAARWRPSPDGRCRSNEMVERTCG